MSDKPFSDLFSEPDVMSLLTDLDSIMFSGRAKGHTNFTEKAIERVRKFQADERRKVIEEVKIKISKFDCGYSEKNIPASMVTATRDAILEVIDQLAQEGKEEEEVIRPMDPVVAKYLIHVHWVWGKTNRFREREEFQSDTLDIADRLRSIADHISKRYCFDCGRIDHPLNPQIVSVVATPVSDSVQLEIGDVNSVFREYEKQERKI